MLISVSDGEQVHDLAIHCPPEATVGLVADAVCTSLDLQVARPTMRSLSPPGRALGRAERLLAADIHDGHVISIVPETVPGRRPRAVATVATLTALTGPEQGRVYSLGAGESRIGRDGVSADVIVRDPAVSRCHAVLRVSDTIVIADAASTNGVMLGGRALVGSARVDPGQSFTIGDTELVVGRLDERATSATLAVRFNPTPRVFAPFAGEQLECPAPPVEPHPVPVPVLSALLPLVVGAGLAALTRSALFLGFVLLSPLVLFASTHESRRQRAKEHAQAMADFQEAVDDVLARQAVLQGEELRSRHEGSPPVDTVASWAGTGDRRLWERGAQDADALSLRVGTATLPTCVTVSVSPGGRVRDRKPLEAEIAPTRVVAGLPVSVPLRNVGHVGIVGAVAAGGLARALITQAAALHSPAVLTIAAMVDPAAVTEWQWLKWLPHTRSHHAPLEGPLLSAQPDAAAGLAERLTGLVRSRREATHGEFAIGSAPVLLVVAGSGAVDPSRLAELLERGPEAGLHVLFLDQSPKAVPRTCGAVVVAGATAGTSSVAFTADGSVIGDVALETLTVRGAEAAARALAPMVDVSARVTDSSRLPSRLALVDALGGPRIMVDPALVRERWAESRGLSAIVGAVGSGPLRLDMRTDGPHALVAGTTGAGKSELLQSLIAALALAHSPKRLNFLLVDYKGGAAFNDCQDLPHTVGLVTDLGPQEVRRALASLEAEFKRREHLLRAAGVANLVDLEAQGRRDTPANLIIVVDEFAVLAKEVPEFVAGVVDLAGRGRSVGMHLVLATQRPAGVISSSIQANVSLRIALRMADEGESIDVIEDGAAAHIDRNTPGRGVYRIGSDQIHAFQAGYVNGRTRCEQRPLEACVRAFPIAGARPLGPDAPVGTGEAGPTDLQRIVGVTTVAARKLRLREPHRPWLDPLPSLLDLGAVARSWPASEGCVVVGELDDPDTQRRGAAVLDLARAGSALVIGAGRSGKTAFLRTVAASIALRGAEATEIYGLDFAGRGLTVLADLPQVGAVIPGDDGERVVRLMTRLQATIARRADLFAVAGVDDLAEYHRRTGDTSERRIVLLLDGIQGFDAAYDRVDRGELVELLPRLIGEGRAAGVHFVISADRRASVPSAVFGLVTTVVVLRQTSPDELANLNLRPDAIAPDAPPGRCFIGGFEAQLALLGSPDGEGQAKAMAELAASQRDAWRAPSIPRIPVEVHRADLGSPPPSAPGRALVGLDAVAFEPVSVDLLDDHFCVLGRRRSGRTNALGILAAGLAGGRQQPKLILVTARPSPLRSVARWTKLVEGAGPAMALVEEMARLDAPAGGRGVVVFVDDLGELGDGFDCALAGLLATRSARVRVVVAAETRAARASYGGSVLTEVRAGQRGLLLQPDLPGDDDLFEAPVSASSTVRFPPGRGVLVEGDRSTLVQVLLP